MFNLTTYFVSALALPYVVIYCEPDGRRFKSHSSWIIQSFHFLFTITYYYYFFLLISSRFASWSLCLHVKLIIYLYSQFYITLKLMLSLHNLLIISPVDTTTPQNVDLYYIVLNVHNCIIHNPFLSAAPKILINDSN